VLKINLHGKELLALNKEYLSAVPFPHLVIDNFLDKDFAASLEDECREAATNVNASNDFTQKGKLALNDWALMQPLMEKACSFFNSGRFVTIMEEITGIKALIPDPHLEGGGLHRTERGGFLKMHTDFNFNKRLNLHRRINVLYYLNSNYQDDWNGKLKLSLTPAREKASQMTAIAPIFNRLVIFNTNDKTFHGHPEPHLFPSDTPRTSLAFYYYSNKKPISERGRLNTVTTKYVPTLDGKIIAQDASLKSRIGYHLRRWTPLG
jgi:Rps23 Pro-64 3,4-dihydroxylase Tpa1-like proline 4-hydroxylase